MSDDDHPSSIFDLSRKGSPKKPTKPLSRAAPPLIKKEMSETVQEIEIEKAFDRMHEMQQDLEKKLDQVMTQGGLTPNIIRELTRGAKGELAAALSKERHSLEEQVMKATGKPVKTRREREESEANKLRKGKSVGAKKRWIRT